MNITKRTTALAAGAAALLALTGCSGGSDEYVLRDGSTMRIITVDGADMVVETMNCDEEIDEDRSEGKMNDSRTYVSWHIDDGEYYNDDNISFSADNEILTFEASRETKVYLREGTDAAQAEWDEHAENCSD